MNMQWIVSTGGPLVCANPFAGKIWGGILTSSINGVESDYDRACEQIDYINIIACGPFQVVVLGDEPFQSSIIIKDDVVIIARWAYCLSNECAINAISTLPKTLPEIEAPKKFFLNGTGLIMFDASLSNVDPSVCASVNSDKGLFLVTTEEYKSEGIYYFIIHRFLKHAKSGKMH